MGLTIAEIRGRANAFAAEWKDDTRERAESQTFWNDWFDVFGISRRRVATFEHRVEKLGGQGDIDVFWPGKLLGEQKSAGRDLDAAMDQALGYLDGVAEQELPQIVVVSDFQRFRVKDLESGDDIEFPIEEFASHIEHFTFLAGYRKAGRAPEDAVNIHAAELMGRIHDQLAASGYTGHDLRVLLVRLVFILFADDSGVWETGLFEDLLTQRTHESGRDVGSTLGELFQVLDTPDGARQDSLDAGLASFPYVNGHLFAEALPIAAFSKEMRAMLIEAAHFDWSKISPAIFGSMFQWVMDPAERHQLGAHYTEEINILKALGPGLLDELEAELAAADASKAKLRAFHARLAEIRVFDPACGCGNFLIVAYRELRRLELEVLKRLRDLEGRDPDQLAFDAAALSKVNVDQMYGIEIEEFPARIAEVALYLMDHLSNQDLSREFGLYYARLPLAASAQIEVADALEIEWDDLLVPGQCALVVGNPPFVGKKNRNSVQAGQMKAIFGSARGAGELDYVAAWFARAAEYIEGHSTRVALVATNSLSQGEQVPALWPGLLARGIAIDFAHRTFAWTSKAPKAAAVYVVIIGFSDSGQRPVKLLFDYATPTADPTENIVSRINPYLVEADNVIPTPRRTPLAPGAPLMVFGSMPNDNGHLILSEDERADLLGSEPAAAPLVRELIGAKEMMRGTHRYCLWLEGASPTLVRSLPTVMGRIAAVKAYREDSTRAATKKLAATPGLFGEIRQPTTRYLCVPRHTSENRRVAPAIFADAADIAHDSTLTLAAADEYWFGLLQSGAWMAWLRTIGGRLTGRLRISVEVVYNTCPWPTASAAQRAAIEAAAREVLDARAAHPGNSLQALYDPLSMPADLVRAHDNLDRAVDGLIGCSAADEAARLARLLELYAAAAPAALPGT